MEKGVLAVISGFSGVGKGTLVKELIKRYDDYALSISATTRSPRPGEENGREYFFLTKEEFKKGIGEGKFLEYTVYVDNYYGTPKDYVLEQMEQGKNIILEIEVEGGFNIKKAFPQAKLIFIVPPNKQELERRLRKRGTETEEEIQRRLARAEEEKVYMNDYDYILVNGDFEDSLRKLNNIIRNKEEQES